MIALQIGNQSYLIKQEVNAMKDARILHLDDERKIGNSIIVTLIEGYRFVGCGDAETVCGFDTMADVRKAMKKIRRVA
jgi:hypothetical protein